ncbi:ABC transporter permease [Albibacterium indicum]|uniref:ABC transporter permease n=1 Tax=Albibacterium indicum TaxID=2292082 RepID=UPI000E4FA869|nr:ABC transporter permease [Pedobacter indicus]
MIRNYLKIAWRNLWKNKVFSAINIFGLALGLTVSTLIALWIQNEVTYDRFYGTTDRLYQVFTSDEFDGEKHAWGATPGILGPVLKQEHPEIDEVVRTYRIGGLLHIGDKRFNAAGVAADSSFFKLFDFKFFHGNSEKAILNPNDVVITASLANKFFGKTDVVGETIQIDTTASLTVTGVIEDIPHNSRFHQIEYFRSWSYLDQRGSVNYQYWTGYNYETFVLLNGKVSHNAVNQKIKNLVVDHSNGETAATIFLHPASKWHLYDKSVNGEMVAGQINTVRLFALVGVFILIIACINFVNLSTAKGEKRAKEVGVRKVVGARKTSLIGQFLSESILLASIAAILSLMLTIVSLPVFNKIMGEELVVNFNQPVFWILFIVFTLFTGFFAGIYPAFFLSSFKVIKTLKGTSTSDIGNITPRRILVVLQFTFSICLIICTLIVSRQIQYGQDRDNGYNQDNLVYISLQGDLEKNYEVIKNELLSSNVAESVNISSGSITRPNMDSWGYNWANSKPEDYNVVFFTMTSDANFVETMGVTLKEGRDIDVYKHPSDSKAILLNETAVKRMRLTDPLNAEIHRNIEDDNPQTWHVVGVVKDFILNSPYEEVEPMMIFGPSWARYIHIRLNAHNNMLGNIEKMKEIFEKYNPNYPFDYQFADEAYTRKFAKQQQIASLTSVFSGLAILIACLGLLGLVAYTTQQRSKEIGIRKVLGASVSGIVSLLSKDFIKLVLIAIVIASPIAWWAMNSWLDDFAYRIEMQWWMFVLAGLAALAIALVTVSSQAIKVAIANPVDSLRDE